MAIAHENMGIQYYRSGQFSAAQAHLGRAVSLYRDSANDLRAVHPLQALGRLYLAEGHVDRAREQAEAALALATEGQDRRAAECYDLLGAVHALRADWKAAEVSFERALGIREHVGHAAGQVDSLVGLGLVHQRRGEWPRAIELFSRAVAVANAMDPSPQKVTARRHLGRLLWLMGQESAATNEMEDALTLAESISKSLEYAPTLLVMAEIRFGAEDVAGAIGYAERALESGITAELTVEAHVVLASLHAMAARPEPARPHAEEALRLAERVGGPRLLGLAWLAAARVAMAADDHLAAERCLRDALDALERAGTPYERALALREFGRALAMDPGQTRRARVMLEEALGLFRQLGAGRAEGRVRDVLRSLQLTGPRSS
jgi:tetratricopeptide (TPR) repeat protein